LSENQRGKQVESHGEEARFERISSSQAMSSTSSYSSARILIDSLHKEDPVYISKQSTPSTEQDELEYADQVEAWVLKLLSSNQSKDFPPGVSLALLQLAARCQHLARFKNPRSDYKDGKLGYLKWRRELYEIQADRAKQLLLQAGVTEEESELVWKWVAKKDLNVGKEEEGEFGTQVSGKMAKFKRK